ncbi:MAG: hypothetical protein HW407_257 [Bacteroidetes bacterium]|nr:hypothetical protein [Bacteroidota bacterium]
MSPRITVAIVYFLLLSTYLAPGALLQVSSSTSNPITREAVAGAEKVIGLGFTEVERDSMLEGLKEQLGNYQGSNSATIRGSGRSRYRMVFHPQ